MWPNSICKEDTVGPELNSQLSYSTDCVIIWPSYHAKHEYKKEWTLAINGERFSQCTKIPVPNNQLKFSQSSQIPQQYGAPGWRGSKISLKWFSLRIALSVIFLKRTILTFFMNPFEVMVLSMLGVCRSFRIEDCGYSMQSIRHAFNTHAISPSETKFCQTLWSRVEEIKQRKLILKRTLQNSFAFVTFFR